MPERASTPDPVSVCGSLTVPGRGSSVADDGVVASIRICVPAVCTASALPTLSVEKYFTVCAPSPDTVTDVPCGDAVVGVLPSVVEYVAATPAPASVGESVTVTLEFPHAEPAAAESSVVTGPVESGVVVNEPLLVLPALSVTVTVRGPEAPAPVVQRIRLRVGRGRVVRAGRRCEAGREARERDHLDPDCASDAVEVTVNVPPAPAGR